MWACTCQDTGVPVRGQLEGVGSLLPSCGSCGLNSGCRVICKSLYAERSHQPMPGFFKNVGSGDTTQTVECYFSDLSAAWQLTLLRIGFCLTTTAGLKDPLRHCCVDMAVGTSVGAFSLCCWRISGHTIQMLESIPQVTRQFSKLVSSEEHRSLRCSAETPSMKLADTSFYLLRDQSSLLRGV